MLGLVFMLFVFIALPRWAVSVDTKQWEIDPSDRYGNLWHRQRATLRALIVLGASIIGHVFWLHADVAALIEGIFLSFLLGYTYFSFDFNTRLNLKRAEKDPSITKWYVSRSKTTAQFDQLLCAIADKMHEQTDIVLKRVTQRSLGITLALYVTFMFLVLH